MSFFSDAFKQIKDAGLEVIEGVGETALQGVVTGIKGATPDATKTPQIGEDGRGRTVTQAEPTNVPAQYGGAVGYIAGLPVWAQVLGGGSVLLLVGSVVYLVVRK